MAVNFRSTGTAADKRRWQKSHIPKCHCARCVGKRQGFPRLAQRLMPEVIEGQLDAGDALFEIAVDTSYICPYCGTEDPPVDENDPNEWQCCIRTRMVPDPEV